MLNKKFIALASAVVMTFSAAGCSSKGLGSDAFKNENVINTSVEAVTAQTSYKADMDLTFAYGDGTTTEEATVATNIASVEAPVNKHITIDTKYGDMQLSQSEFYVDAKDDEVSTMYFSYEDGWFKADVDGEMLFGMLGQYDMKSFVLTLLACASNPVVGEKETVNGTECYKVDAIIPSANVPYAALHTGIFVVTGLVSLDEENMAGVPDVPVTFWVDAKTGNVCRVEFDAKDIYQTIENNVFEKIANMAEYEGSQKMIVEKYIVSADITDINNTSKTTVPEDALAAEDLTEDLNAGMQP